MSGILKQPFGFYPSSSPFRTSSTYTVPAGKYACVQVFFTHPRAVSGSVTIGKININGNEILRERFYHIQNLTSLTISGFSGLFRGTSSGFTTGTVVNSGGQSTTIDSGGGGSLVNFGFYDSFSITNSVYINGSIVNFSEPTSSEIWLKEGDVLSGSNNWFAIITEFNK